MAAATNAWYEDEKSSIYGVSEGSDYVQMDQASQVPEWWQSAIQRIAYLLQLTENWDGYGALAVKQQNAFYAVQILQQISRPRIPRPSIVPTVRGNLQFEWHMHGIDFEFEVISPTRIWVSFEDHQTGDEWEKDLDYNLMPLADVVKQLLVRQVAAKHGN